MRLDPGHFAQAIGNRAPLGLPALNRASPQARGLVAGWPFQPKARTALFDIGAAPARAVVQDPANVTSVVTPFGVAGLSFPGSGNNDVIVPDSAKFDLSAGDEITIAVWVDFQGNLGQSSWSHIVSKRTAAGGAAVWGLALTNAGEIVGRFMAGGTERIVKTSASHHGAGMKHVVFTRKAGAGTDTAIYVNGAPVALASPQNNTSNLDNATRDVWFGARDGEQTNRKFNGVLGAVALYDRAWSAGEARAAYDPETRWGLYREPGLPRVWPKTAGGAVTRTSIGSLQAVVRRQANFLASTDAALRAEAAVSALAGAALARIGSRSASLELAVQAVRQAQADLDAALTRTLNRGAGLDANLTLQGAFQRSSALDGAIRRLKLVSGALEAALSAIRQDSAALDAWVALSLVGTAGLDAAAMRRGQLSDTALQGVLRATPGRAAALDAVIGLVVAAAASRTRAVGARGGKSIADGQRRHAIPSGNRRH